MVAEDAQPAQADLVQVPRLAALRLARGLSSARGLAATPAATRTASALAGTSWTRAHQAPAAAARAVIATVASSQSANGRGVPSRAASSLPRNRLRDAPISTGNGVTAAAQAG